MNNFEKLKELDMQEFADKLAPSMFETCIQDQCIVYPYCERYPAHIDCKDIFMDWLKDTRKS